MKKILAMLLVPFFTLQAQPTFWLESNKIDKDINGGTIQKNDTVALVVKLNPAGTTIRGAYFDFQHQHTAIQMLDIVMGPALPTGATSNVNNYFYPNCKLNKNAQNNTTNGWNNYVNASYTCNSQTVPNEAINRIYVNVASNQTLLQATYMTIRFRVTNVSAGFAYDSIYMNFAFGYDVNGGTITTTQNNTPRAAFIELASGANNLVTGEVKLNQNFPLNYGARLDIMTTGTSPTQVATKTLGAGGAFGFAQELSTSTTYNSMMFVNADSIAKLSIAAVTVSDYTTAYQEFLSQNLDRTFKNTNINRGIKYRIADVNNNNEFDGGDVQRLFNAVTGLDTLFKKPTGCGTNCFVSIPLFRTATYDSLGFTSWKSFTTFNNVPITTTTADQTVSLSYMIPGDVNLSHSSPTTAGTGAALRMSSLVVPNAPSIDVNLNNVVVTSNNITIPFDIDTKGVSLSGLQFQVNYDASKVKFERMDINTPSWISFVLPTQGVVKFGAVDQLLKNPITGKIIPFKLQFTSLQPGVNLNSAITITSLMDAADSRGNQVGINFNTTVVKLIGANNFLKP